MKIQDIKLANYNKLQNTYVYDIWIDYIQPRPYLQGIKSKDKQDLTFDEVSFLKKYLQKFDFQNFEMFIKIFFHNFEQIKITDLYFFDFVAWYKFVINEIESIIEIENTINYDADPIMKVAGIDKLERFGELNTKIQLGEQFGKLPNEIGQMLWADVVTILMYNAEKSAIEKTYYEIKSKQNADK